jgi:hypothetical protein
MPWTVADVEQHKKGLSDKQKKRWVVVANDALHRCVEKGGAEKSCTASAIRRANAVIGKSANQNMQNFLVHSDSGYEVRHETLQGRKHLVVPVIMMTEGVHCGSGGCLLHPAEELGKIPASWNGMPVSIHHPRNSNDEFISANSPEVMEEVVVGTVFNTRMDGDRLRAEAWLDEERLKEVSTMSYAYIMEGKPLDVSVGVFTEDEPTSGEWHGEPYEAVARNHRPDHLALLPGEQGACSWADGCGIRSNQKGGGDVTKMTKIALSDLLNHGLLVCELSSNERGMNEALDSLQRKLDSLEDATRFIYLMEAYDDYVIYQVRSRTGGPSGYFRRGYKFNSDNTVEFTGEPVSVRREVNYVEVQNNNSDGGKSMSQNNAKKDKKPCCPEKVQALIEGGLFAEEDREALGVLSEEAVDHLATLSDKTSKKGDDSKKEEPPQNNAAAPTAEQAIQVLRDQLKTPEQFLSLMPKDMQESIRYSLNLANEKKTELIHIIVANGNQTFTKEDLKDWGMVELQKLAKALSPLNFSGAGAGADLNANTGGVVPLLPPLPKVNTTKKEKED